MSALIQTPPVDPLDAESASYEAFVRSAAARPYRTLLDDLYAYWHECNDAFFGGLLRAPHLSIGRTAPRQYSHCRPNTNYGGRTDVTVDEGVAFGTNRRVVHAPYPAEGTRRFLRDIVVHELPKQYVLEAEGETEDGYGGYGPRYVAVANRIADRIGVARVLARRRGRRDAAAGVAATWRWGVRPDGYYLGHVSPARAGGLRARRRTRSSPVPGVFEYLLFLLVSGRTDRLRGVLERQVDADRERQSTELARAERGPVDGSGRPQPLPAVDPAWLAWNGGCVALMAEHIADLRAFGVMPVLADALEDAGCHDPDILGHCRAETGHTRNCWVLLSLRASASGSRM